MGLIYNLDLLWIAIGAVWFVSTTLFVVLAYHVSRNCLHREDYVIYRSDIRGDRSVYQLPSNGSDPYSLDDN